MSILRQMLAAILLTFAVRVLPDAPTSSECLDDVALIDAINRWCTAKRVGLNQGVRTKACRS